MTTEAETGVIHLQTKECPGFSEAGRGKKERKILEASEEKVVLPTF